MNRVEQDIEILCIQRRGQLYIWLYTEETQAAVVGSIGRMASNPELDLNWYDAAVLAGKVVLGEKGSSTL